MISIALCTYNGEKYIAEQLRSIFNQTLLPDEIVISDDDSKDRTIEIIEELKKETTIDIKTFVNKPSLGVYKNFEQAILKCSGDIILCSDQDDIWKKEKIEKTVNKLNEGNILAFCNASVVLNDIEHYVAPLWNKKQIKEKKDLPYKSFVMKGTSAAGCLMAFKKELVNKIIPFPDEIYHDDWLVTCGAILGKIGIVDEELMYYRQHGDNVVGIKRGNKLSYFKSLLCNTKPYIEHRKYIYERNKKMFKSLIEKGLVEDVEGLEECLIFNEHEATLIDKSFKEAKALAKDDLKKTYYDKYSDGYLSYLYDIYLSVHK